MAFHVACPITCKRVCFCNLGFPKRLQNEKARKLFLEEVDCLSEFLTNSFGHGVGDGKTVQVFVPKVVKPPPVVPLVIGDGGVEGDEAVALSTQTKRVALQKKAAVASMVNEDYARRFESGDLLDAARDLVGEDHDQSSVNVMCRMCFSGENEGSEKARRMLSCKTCGKKYHRSCIKKWSQHRDLFHWSSWSCPSCRNCELCRKTGDPNKFLFCKRCDGAYHCYCQHPPHKNVSAGPYLCQKHTRCHSCGSNVPGNGLSVRWFLGYTCCDACGRLFVKGNYCPICLKVYRDSESTPMVCCDVCQRWVHCHCDGISDEKYLQYQADGNLEYKCATCRGECYEVKDLEDAVRELWRRRDKADRDLIATQRAAAGLPTEEEIFSITPYSDDEDDGPILLKNDFGRSLKFMVKGIAEKSPKHSPKKTKEHGNKSSNKKKSHKTERSDMISTPIGVGNNEGICSVNKSGVVKRKFVDEVTVSNEDKTQPRTVRFKGFNSHDIEAVEDGGKNMSKTVKGTPKLVIHLGSRNKNVLNSPRSDVSSSQREHDLVTSKGSEETSHPKTSDDKLDYGKGDKLDNNIQLKSSTQKAREGNSIKPEKIKSESSDLNLTYSRRNTVHVPSYSPKENTHVVLGKRNLEGAIESIKEVPVLRGDKVSHALHESRDSTEHSQMASVSQSLPKDSKPLLKLKLKNPYHENQSSWAVPQGEEEKSLIKGQRSKRKRPSSFMENFSQVGQDQSKDETVVDANRISKNLGKDLIGKRVEVYLQPENSWVKGMVSDVVEGTSMFSLDLDDGRLETLEFGKQEIRFVAEKKKRSRT